MNRTSFIGLFLVTCFTFIQAKTIDIIPVPASVQESKGVFNYRHATISANTPKAQAVASLFADRMQELYGIPVLPSANKANIVITVDPSFDLADEAYRLTVARNKVTVEARTEQGAFYATQSLVLLGSPAPCCEIVDAPRFGYRGFHLDPCRHFITVENVKKQIDLMSLFKINTLHFHLTDDQGWRIEIKKYPALIARGATRVDGEGTIHKGYYTQEQIRDIVAYAAERYITIIPEIDMPGHMVGAISAYPELSCFSDSVSPRIVWGVEKIVLCPGKEMVFGFLEDVIKEVCALFPAPYFHIGGDECPKLKWQTCPACQERIAQEHLEAADGHTAEQRLQSYFTNRMEGILAKYGKKIIGWDEILEGGLSPNATVMSWRGESGGIAAALQDHDVIMTSSRNGLYLDYYQGDFRIEPVTISNRHTALLSKTYSYDPVPHELYEKGKAGHILGVQCNNWSEYMYTNEKMEYMMYPRALALSEIAWSELDRKDFTDFCRRLDVICAAVLDKKGFTYHIPLPEQPYGSCNTIAFVDEAVLTFTTSRPMKMVYTLDGSVPCATSAVYTEPLRFTSDTTLRIASILPSGKISPVRTISIVKQPLAPATEVNNVQSGLIMQRAEGYFHTISEVNPAALQWTTSILSTWSDLKRDERDEDIFIRGGTGFVSIAEGYIYIPEDGVYYLSSKNEQVFIDHRLVISNEGEVKRFSTHDISLALAKGLHPIKVVYLNNITGGWATCWDKNPSVQIRYEKEEAFRTISDEQLFHSVYTNYAVILPTDDEQTVIDKASHVVPSERQFLWQRQELTAFLHFGVNTYTNREWGKGNESPAIFNPVQLDADQWISTLKQAGFRCAILTCKHHDGFCLWPSAYTDHSVKNSPWMDGKGDVVRAVSEACHKHGIGFGVYLSPWDRHSPLYGTDEYNDYFVNQLTELLTNYGEVSEVWFDGACGEGPNGKKQVYDFVRWYELIRTLQPKAVIASMGPDVRWVGTETGRGRETEWSIVPNDKLDQQKIAANSQQEMITPPIGDMTDQDLGSRDAIRKASTLVWYPAETDVSIRKGWFYHESQDTLVKTPDKLMDIYFTSVGRNGVLLLNVPPNRDGLIADADVRALRGFRQKLDATFATNILADAAVKELPEHMARVLTDGNYDSSYEPATNQTITLTFTTPAAREANTLMLQEDIRKSQLVEHFTLEYLDSNGKWSLAAEGTTIGYKRLIRFDNTKAKQWRLTINQARAAIHLTEIGLYLTQ